MARQLTQADQTAIHQVVNARLNGGQTFTVAIGHYTDVYSGAELAKFEKVLDQLPHFAARPVLDAVRNQVQNQLNAIISDETAKYSADLDAQDAAGGQDTEAASPYARDPGAPPPAPLGGFKPAVGRPRKIA